MTSTALLLIAVGWIAASALAVALGVVVRRRRTRDELTARACHELRGPLTAAELALHGLGRRGLPVAPAQAELARARLALADLAAAPHGAREADRPAAVDVSALLARHEAAWRALAEASGARLRVHRPTAHAPASVHGDPGRIAQAVANLVANAAEHAGGVVHVAVRATRGTVAVEVRDAGPGLPAPVAELIARPRAGRGTRGRGLAIAADVAARHGGHLATAPAARGARLLLVLPAVTEAGASAGRRIPRAAGAAPAAPPAARR